MDRRAFISRSLVGSGVALSGPAFWRAAYAEPAVPGPGPYGTLDGRTADELGLVLPEGFTARVVATSGEVVPGTEYTWHGFPDGGACFADPDGGWVYASNSEIGDQKGGVGALRFDADGEVVDAYRLVSGTSRNCGGGPTPWGTWLTGEEVLTGLIWECDPFEADSGVPRPLLGAFNHEAAAVDPDGQAIYLTEDWPDGRFYRFTPDAYPDLDAGVLEVAIEAEDGSVTWGPVEDPAGTTVATREQGGGTPYDGGEGIWCEDGVVFWTTKGDDVVRMYHLEDQRMEVLYDAATIPDAPLTGVDNITRSAAGDLYVCEDSGNMELVLISAEREVTPFCRFEGQEISELAGVAFSPAGDRLYISSQRGGPGNAGLTYEIAGPFRQPVVEEPPATTTTIADLAAPSPDLPDGDGDGDSNLLLGIGAGAVVVAAAVGAGVALRRRRAGSATGDPVATDDEDPTGDGVGTPDTPH